MIVPHERNDINILTRCHGSPSILSETRSDMFFARSKKHTRVQQGFRRVETCIARFGLCMGAVFLLAAPDHIQSANRWWIIKYAVHISCARAGPERRTRRGVACISFFPCRGREKEIEESTGCAHRSMNAPPARSMRIRSPLSKTKKPPNGDFLFWWTRRMIVCISFFPCGGREKEIEESTGCAHRSMNAPPARSMRIRSPLSKTKKPPNGDFLFWWTRRGSNPRTSRMRTVRSPIRDSYNGQKAGKYMPESNRIKKERIESRRMTFFPPRRSK